MKCSLLSGDVMEQLKTLKDSSINTCVTSPPYYGLRDYGMGTQQIGLEETPEEYVERLVKVFHEVRRVLRDDGVLWVNIGDSYAGSGKGRKPKDLIGIPWMLAFALRADGWYLRQDIIWAKNNPMPESVKDRCTRSHEYIFMLTKSRKYYFDHEAIQEPTITYDENKRDRDHTKLNNTPGRTRMAGLTRNDYKTRNKRDVWRISVAINKEAHFAVFPKELIEPCILAGCPKDGWVLDPFSGSGTTGIVSVNNNRNYIGIDLNPEYNKIAERRLIKECTNAFTVVVKP